MLVFTQCSAYKNAIRGSRSISRRRNMSGANSHNLGPFAKIGDIAARATVRTRVAKFISFLSFSGKVNGNRLYNFFRCFRIFDGLASQVLPYYIVSMLVRNRPGLARPFSSFFQLCKVLPRPSTQKDGINRPRQNPHVQPDRPVTDVVSVVYLGCFDAAIAAHHHLPHTSQAWTHAPP